MAIYTQQQSLYQKVASLLTERYGYPTWRPHLPPVDELVSTILSQNTSDTNRDKGFFALKERYTDWESVMTAPVETITEIIRPSGLANQKAPRIQSALKYIYDQQGHITLDFLKTLSIPEAKQWLTAINGIGPKTAAIILLFSMNIPAFPVDTHVHRVTQRIGFIPQTMNADKAHDELEQIIPPEDYYPAHLNIIRHGREICKARKPLCNQCFLTQHCRYYQNLSKGT